MGIVHDHAGHSAVHVHADGHAHDRSAFAQVDESGVWSTESGGDPVAPGDHPKSSGGRCCGMVCVTALPATFAELTGPSALTSRCEPARHPRIADDAPPALYRPPNV